MRNLLSTLSQELQTKLADFKVSIVFIECGDVNVRSEYDMDFSYYNAIEKELSDSGHAIN
jgi:HKD family nuclease